MLRLRDHRPALRALVWRRYAASLQTSPTRIVDFHLGMLTIAVRHLQEPARFAVADRVRDCRRGRELA